MFYVQIEHRKPIDNCAEFDVLTCPVRMQKHIKLTLPKFEVYEAVAKRATF